MSEFKGTKGPWVVYPTDSVKSHLDIAVNSEKSNCICWVYSKSDYMELNGKANAKLISKAPEMLEMLKKLSERLEINAINEEDDSLVLQANNLINEATSL